MVIIAGRAYVEDRDTYVAEFRHLVTTARAFDGCLDVAVSADPVEPDRVNVFELWESAERMEAFRAIAPVPTDAPAIVRDEVWRYDAGAARPPF